MRNEKMAMKLQQWRFVSDSAMKINMGIPLISFVYIVVSTLILLSLTACGGGGGGNPVFNDHAFAVAIQSDGKIVAAGETFSSSNGWCVSLARYASNGSLDMSFGNGGKVLTVVSGGATAVAIQNDGKIVVAGYDHIYSFVLVRFNSDGTLDTSFGNSGQVLTNLGGGASAIAIQSDGRIVAAGYSYNTYGYDFALTRYNGNGTLDVTFGSRGAVISDASAYSIMGGGASSLAIQTDGKIVAAGGSYLIRYNSDGSLDTTFNLAGKVISGSYYETMSGVGIQTDGKIVAAGSSYNGMGSYDFALTRYNIDGSPDFTFNGNGRAVTPVMSLYPLGPATVVPDQSNGKIVAAGYSQYQFVLARYNSDGSPDTTFASVGEIITTGGGYWSNNSFVNDIAVQNDGKIVVAGSSYKDDVSGYDFALARHNSDGSIDAGFGSGGKVTTGM
jgi:uncharacterized delta-60 repeat protein